jgi:hypothetical protein
MVRVIVSGTEASVEGLKWTCERKDVLGLVQACMRLFRTGPWDPYPDLHAAEFVIEKLGGKVLKADLAPTTEKGRIY